MDDYRKMIDHAKRHRHVAGTPRRITPEILGFCATLAEGANPTYMPVTPEPFAQVAKCYSNVLESCGLIGGTPHLGWLIWELHGIYLTAEHHAVVERDGYLFDVTPQVHGEARVLFLPIPDPLPEEASNTPNRYMPLADHELVRRAVRLIEANSLLFARGGFDTLQYRRNDEEAAGCMDRYLRLLKLRHERAAKESERTRKKAARKRR